LSGIRFCRKTPSLFSPIPPVNTWNEVYAAQRQNARRQLR
jgi:hypothetical protein